MNNSPSRLASGARPVSILTVLCVWGLFALAKNTSVFLQQCGSLARPGVRSPRESEEQPCKQQHRACLSAIITQRYFHKRGRLASLLRRCQSHCRLSVCVSVCLSRVSVSIDISTCRSIPLPVCLYIYRYLFIYPYSESINSLMSQLVM